jgi:Tol biopolymer transport system component
MGSRVVYAGRGMGNWVRVLVVLTAVAVAGFAGASTASGAFPGTNGQIAFSPTPLLPPIGGEPGDLETHSQVFAIQPDGTGLTQLTHVAEDLVAGSPDISPNGKRIVYQSNESGSFNVWVMDIDGGHQTQLTDESGFEDFQPSWSPDGKSILFSRCGEPFGYITYCDIESMKANGSNEQALLSAGHWLNVRPTYSPNGSKISFSSDKGGLTSTVWVMNADGSSPKRLTKARQRAFWPDWAPDGKRILFGDHCCVPHSNLWTVRPDGSGLRKLTHVPPDQDAGFASFSPNGREILTVLFTRHGPTLQTLRSNGGHFRQVSGHEAFLSDWGAR